MEINLLHSFHGDKKRELSTETAEQRAMTAEAIALLKQQGIALFLEQGKKAYRIEGYDPEEDKLIVRVPLSSGGMRIQKKQLVKAMAEKSGRKVTGVAPVRGG